MRISFQSTKLKKKNQNLRYEHHTVFIWCNKNQKKSLKYLLRSGYFLPFFIFNNRQHKSIATIVVYIWLFIGFVSSLHYMQLHRMTFSLSHHSQTSEEFKESETKYSKKTWAMNRSKGMRCLIVSRAKYTSTFQCVNVCKQVKTVWLFSRHTTMCVFVTL